MTSLQLNRLADYVKSRGGNNSYIKGKQSSVPSAYSFQGFSASGPDVWVPAADYSEDGVVISAVGARCGKTFYAQGSWTAIANTHALIPRQGLDAKYLWYLTNDEEFWVKGGSAQPFVKVKETLEKLVYIPSLDEQKRIVAKLDEAVALMSEFHRLSASITDNCDALYGNWLSAKFKSVSSPSNEQRLGSLVTRLTNGYVGPTRDIYTDGGIPYLLARHVRNNKLKFDGRTYISEEFNIKNKKSMLKSGDVVLVQSGHIGHSAVISDEHEGHNCHAMIVITPVEKVLRGDYLSLFFTSILADGDFAAIRSGSTVPHLTCKEIRELSIPVLDLNEQQSIVDESETLLEQVEKLKHFATARSINSHQLVKTLLSDAFTGEL